MCYMVFKKFATSFIIYKGRHKGCCLAYIGNTSNLDGNHHGSHCILQNGRHALQTVKPEELLAQ